MNYKKFGTNLGGRAFFFFGFTHRLKIENQNSFVLNTLLPAGRCNFEKQRSQNSCIYFLRLAGNGIRLCVRAAILNILALQINLISRLTYSRCYGAFLIQNQNDSNSKVSGSNLLR